MNKNSVTDRDGGALVEGGSGELAKNDIAKWRLMLMGATCLVGVDLASTPSAALDLVNPLLLSPTEAWRVNTSRPCTTNDPGDWEVFIYREASPVWGECAALEPGLYPYPWNLGLEDKQISAVKVGKNVRAILFENPVYKGKHSVMRGCQNGETLGCGGSRNLADWNDRGSSMRVEINSRSSECRDLKRGEIGLYWFGGDNNTQDGADCIVLPTLRPDGNEFAHPEVMGIADNSISRIDLNNTLNGSCSLSAFADANYQGDQHDFLPSKTNEWGFNVKIKYLLGKISSIKLFCP